MLQRILMRIHLLLCGLLTAATASPTFAQSAANPHLGTGNYNLSGSYGGKNSGVSVLGDNTVPGMNVGGSSLGNGNVGTSYGRGSLNAGSGLEFDGGGLSDGMTGLPSPGAAPAPPSGRLHPMR
jgi:hypothetical protein